MSYCMLEDPLEKIWLYIINISMIIMSPCRRTWNKQFCNIILCSLTFSAKIFKFTNNELLVLLLIHAFNKNSTWVVRHPYRLESHLPLDRVLKSPRCCLDPWLSSEAKAHPQGPYQDLRPHKSCFAGCFFIVISIASFISNVTAFQTNVPFVLWTVNRRESFYCNASSSYASD